MKPTLAQTQLVKKYRNDKQEEEELRQKIREEYLYECPKSSAEKTAAEVFKRVAEHKLKIKQGGVANLNTEDETFKPMLSRNLSRNLQVRKMHNGVWEYNEADKRVTWSCCMSEDFKSPGCVANVRNLDRWITISL